jgi:hypothetical protein
MYESFGRNCRLLGINHDESRVKTGASVGHIRFYSRYARRASRDAQRLDLFHRAGFLSSGIQSYNKKSAFDPRQSAAQNKYIQGQKKL